MTRRGAVRPLLAVSRSVGMQSKAVTVRGMFALCRCPVSRAKGMARAAHYGPAHATITVGMSAHICTKPLWSNSSVK